METTISISEMARRSGVAASALRFYEAEGLLTAERSPGGRRRYPRSTLRRIAFIRAAKAVGLSVEEIGGVLDALPDKRTPTKADWAALSESWMPLIEARIRALETLRDSLTGCIGCGCLSLSVCKL
jgi:MerR family redox-sensitive transcriptional activator SoxR